MSLSRKQSEATSMLQVTMNNLQSMLELKNHDTHVTYPCVSSSTIVVKIRDYVEKEQELMGSLLTPPLTSN